MAFDFHSVLSLAKATWRLSPRQIDVLALIARGLPNKLIADELKRSIGTVEYHVTDLFKKAGVGNRCELVVALWRLTTQLPL